MVVRRGDGAIGPLSLCFGYNGLDSLPRHPENKSMSKTIQQIEARLERLEKELAEVKAALAGKPKGPWYRKILGDFAGDTAYAEIVRLGRLVRSGKLKG